MRILTNGCSFTARSATSTWPYLLGTNEVKNLAEHGAGNQWICDGTIAELCENSYDLVLIMWSGLARLDWTVEKEFCQSMPVFKEEEYTGGPIVFTSVNNFNIHYIHNEQDCFKSVSAVTGIRERTFNSLMRIISLQSYLKSRNINYRFMSYMNFWEDVYGLGFEKLDHQIDFSRWLFTDNDRNGLYELSQDQNLYADDGFHPNEQAHEQWASLIRTNINDR